MKRKRKVLGVLSQEMLGDFAEYAVKTQELLQKMDQTSGVAKLEPHKKEKK